MKKYTLEAIVFLCGGSVMVLELTGSRVLAPYVGTSLFVWTSLIGIILGALSLGYAWGGKIADRNPNVKTFSRIIFGAGALIGVMALVQDAVLIFLSSGVSDVRLSAILSSIILFACPSLLLGMISPYAVRLKLEGMSSSGATVGNLYALSTLGSISGTFLAGFYLIAVFPTTFILYMLAALLVVLSLFVHVSRLKTKIAFVITLGLLNIGFASALEQLRGPDFIEANTMYNRVWIHNSQDSQTGLDIKLLLTNQARSSAMYLESDELVFAYNRFFHLARHFYPDFQKALLIGGAAYSFPRDFLQKYPNAKLDVVEIDPGLTEIARQHFKLKDDPRLRIFHEDGRILLNRTQEKYDVIFGDAFYSINTIPFHLTTVESVRKMYDALNEKGVVIANLISAIEGDKGKFLRAEYHTFKSVFPQVYIFQVREKSPVQSGNLILVALKSKESPNWASTDPQIAEFLSHLWEKEIPNDMPVLRDEWAPTDQLVLPLLVTKPYNEIVERVKKRLRQFV